MAELDDPTLADPDAESEARYDWDEDFQRHIISMLLLDRQFLLQGMDLVKSTYFTNRVHVKACEVLFKYFERYKSQPDRTIITQEIKDDLKGDKALPYYMGELNAIYDYFLPGMDARDYLTDKIAYFAKIQALRKAFNDSLEEVNKDPENPVTWDKVYHTLQQAMLVDRSFDIGTNYLKDAEPRYERMAEEEASGDVFPLGIPSVDQELKGGGYRRGQSIAIMADSGVGKSVMLACILAHNSLRDKKCLYISCENDEDEIADRLDAILTGAPIQKLYDYKEDVFDKLEGKVAVGQKDDGEPVYFDPEESPIIIKKFPQKSADVNTIRAYLIQLKMRGFKPDMVVVDYVGEMKDYPGVKTYESREQLVDEMTGLASEEDFFMATALQPNRAGKEVQEAGHLSQDNIADSFGQMRPLFGCITLNQNDRESAIGVGRGWVEKQRNGRKHYQFYLNFDKNTLKITELGKETYKDRMSSHNEKVVAEVETDLIQDQQASAEDINIDSISKEFSPDNLESDGEDTQND